MATINENHRTALIDYFSSKKGKKGLFLSPSYPFLFIGIIKNVIDDYIYMKADVTQYPQLEDKDWYIHIDQIEVFYVEENQLLIPELKS